MCCRMVSLLPAIDAGASELASVPSSELAADPGRCPLLLTRQAKSKSVCVDGSSQKPPDVRVVREGLFPERTHESSLAGGVGDSMRASKITRFSRKEATRIPIPDRSTPIATSTACKPSNVPSAGVAPSPSAMRKHTTTTTSTTTTGPPHLAPWRKTGEHNISIIDPAGSYLGKPPIADPAGEAAPTLARRVREAHGPLRTADPWLAEHRAAYAGPQVNADVHQSRGLK